MTKNGFKDTRLLEALDYIDQDLIGEVAVKLRFEESAVLTEEPVITWRTPFKHWKRMLATVACLLLLSAAFPVLNYAVQRFGTGIWEGNAGAGTEGLEVPTPTETEVLETEPEMTQTLETEPTTTEAEILDSGFDKYLEAFADMSADEIYAEVLKVGWVVIGDGNSDFATGEELWLDFFDKSQKGEPAYALIADYARINDQKSEIVLYEIIFDGDMFYYQRMYNNQIVSDEYKYLIHGIATKSTMRFADEAYFLTNNESMTLDDFNENMLSASQTFPIPVAVIHFRK